MNGNFVSLQRNYNELVEMQYVLQKAVEFFGEQPKQDITSNLQRETPAPGATEMGDPAATAAAAGGGGAGVGGAAGSQPASSATVSLATLGGGVKVNFVTGTLEKAQAVTFERVLWRATRGNMYFRSAEPEPVTDPITNLPVEKIVFIIFFQGARAEQKITRLCESFAAHMYQISDNGADRRDAYAGVQQQIRELSTVLDRTREVRERLLSDIAQSLPGWQVKVRKEKAIYHQMNLFYYDQNRKCLLAEGWCPKNATESLQLALRRATDRSGALIPSLLQVLHTDATPPTYFEVNKYTSAFQAVVNAYAVPSYGELNPAPLSLITFPFQFGIMFGDIAHGLMLALFACYLIYRERDSARNPITGMMGTLYKARYLIFLMGIFAAYNGALYNEVFAIPVNIFPSAWSFVQNGTAGNYTYIPVFSKTYTYPFGVDPAWGRNLAYSNPMKMKMSVIIGVIHMTMGLILSALNDRHEGHWIDFKWVFIPEIVFFSFTFGYLTLLIIIKWLIDFSQPRWANTQAPSLLNLLIDMFLNPFTLYSNPNNRFYTGQAFLQNLMLICCFAALPIMLLAKPYLLWKQNRTRRIHDSARIGEGGSNGSGGSQGGTPEEGNIHAGGSLLTAAERAAAAPSASTATATATATASHAVTHPPPSSASSSGGSEHGHGGGETFSLMEVGVSSLIHTIEFALGSISNTASYLRLFALSLAHSQLAEVFWERMFVPALLLPIGGWLKVVMMIVAFFMWAMATLGILLVMETLSAFLHALRLHWVEFQNKFYKGEGVKFAPWSYEVLLAPPDDV